MYMLFWRRLCEPGSRYVAQAGLKLVILLPQIPELWNYRDTTLRGCIGFQTTQMSYTPSELTSILPDSPPSPSMTWLPVLPISIPATTYTATQTAQPCSGFIRPLCLSPLSLGPCHRKQHAPAGVTSQPEQYPCLLP